MNHSIDAMLNSPCTPPTPRAMHRRRGSGVEEVVSSIRVAVRVRPFSKKEQTAGARRIVEMDGDTTILTDPTMFLHLDESPNDNDLIDDTEVWRTQFTFDRCFWSFDRSTGPSGYYASQQTVFDTYGPWIIENAVEGFNCSLFAYGQTGSGKTHTMMGSDVDISPNGDAGFIPRLCSGIFGEINKRSIPRIPAIGNEKLGRSSFHIEASYFEIYNERVFDLLNPNNRMDVSASLRVREHPKTGAYVEDLLTIVVSSYHEIEELLKQGSMARRVAETKMNKESSRSHAVFQLNLHKQRELPDAKRVEQSSRLYLVDLAGSERVSASGATGARLKEAANINRSLSALSDVIKALTTPRANDPSGKHFVPYRNSALTWLLKESLGGNAKTVMLATVSPDAVNYQETLSTLKYAERAKKIVNKARVNKESNAALVEALQLEIQQLREQLARYEHEVNETPSSPNSASSRGKRSDVDRRKLLVRLESQEKLVSSLSASWEQKRELAQEHFAELESQNAKLQQERAEMEAEMNRLRSEKLARELEDEKRRQERQQRQKQQIEQQLLKRKQEQTKQQSAQRELEELRLRADSLEEALIAAQHERDIAVDECSEAQRNQAILEKKLLKSRQRVDSRSSRLESLYRLILENQTFVNNTEEPNLFGNSPEGVEDSGVDEAKDESSSQGTSISSKSAKSENLVVNVESTLKKQLLRAQDLEIRCNNLEMYKNILRPLEEVLGSSKEALASALERMSSELKKDKNALHHFAAFKETELQQAKQLNEAEARLQSDVDALRHQLEATSHDLSLKNEEVKALNVELSGLKSNIQVSDKEQVQFQQHVQAMTQELLTKEKAVTSIAEELEKTQTLLGAQRDDITSTQAELRQACDRNKRLQDELEQTQSQLNDTQDQLRVSQENLEVSHNDLSKAQQEIKALTQDLVVKQNALSMTSNELEKAVAQVESQREDLSTFRKELDEVSEERGALKEQLQESLDALDVEKEERLQSEQREQTKIVELAEKEAVMCKYATELEHSLSQLESRNREITGIQQELREVCGERNLLQNQLQEARSATNAESKEKLQFENTLQSITTELTAKQELLSAQSEQLKDARKQIESQVKELAQIQQKLKSVYEENEDLQQCIKDIQNNKSSGDEKELQLQQDVLALTKELTAKKESRAALSKELEESRTQLETERNEVAVIRLELENTDVQNKLLQRQLQDAHSNVESANAKQQQLQQEMQKVSEELKARQDSLTTLSQKLDVAHTQIVTLQNNLEMVHQDLKQSREENQVLQGALQDEREARESAERAKSALDEDLRKTEELSNIHAKEIGGLKADIERLQRELCAKTNASELLSSELEGLRQQSAHWRQLHQDDIRTLELQISSMEADHTALSAKLKRASEELETFQSSQGSLNRDWESKCMEKDSEVEELEEQLRAQQQSFEIERKELNLAVTTALSQLSVLQSNLSLLEKSNHSVSQARTREKDSLEGQMHTLIRDKSILEGELRSKIDECDRWRSSEMNAIKANSRLEIELLTVKDQNNFLEETEGKLRDQVSQLCKVKQELTQKLYVFEQQSNQETSALKRSLQQLQAEVDALRQQLENERIAFDTIFKAQSETLQYTTFNPHETEE